jgi:hypothetical protein
MKSFGTEVLTRILDTKGVEIFGTEIRTVFGIDIQTVHIIFIPTNAQ